jgi:hypothetical protein
MMAVSVLHKRGVCAGRPAQLVGGRTNLVARESEAGVEAILEQLLRAGGPWIVAGPARAGLPKVPARRVLIETTARGFGGGAPE